MAYTSSLSLIVRIIRLLFFGGRSAASIGGGRRRRPGREGGGGLLGIPGSSGALVRERISRTDRRGRGRFTLGVKFRARVVVPRLPQVPLESDAAYLARQERFAKAWLEIFRRKVGHEMIIVEGRMRHAMPKRTGRLQRSNAATSRLTRGGGLTLRATNRAKYAGFVPAARVYFNDMGERLRDAANRAEPTGTIVREP